MDVSLYSPRASLTCAIAPGDAMIADLEETGQSTCIISRMSSQLCTNLRMEELKSKFFTSAQVSYPSVIILKESIRTEFFFNSSRNRDSSPMTDWQTRLLVSQLLRNVESFTRPRTRMLIIVAPKHWIERRLIVLQCGRNLKENRHTILRINKRAIYTVSP